MTGILLSTCDRYAPLARYTRSAIGAEWPDHPEIFESGLSTPGPGRLPLDADPRDWMAVTRSAANALRERGFRSVYLLLEDHPPLGRCNAAALNRRLPEALEVLDATSIALSGYGQRRTVHGETVRWRGRHFDRVPVRQLWKFPLHPALWNLERLIAILDFLMERLPPGDRTPWAFERVGGDPNSTMPRRLNAHSYRIDGLEWTGRPGARLRHLPVSGAQLAGDVWKFLVRITAGPRARAAWDQSLRWLYCGYDGPYPLFWSGAMQKGRPNPDLLRYLSRTGQWRRRRALEQAMAACR